MPKMTKTTKTVTLGFRTQAVKRAQQTREWNKVRQTREFLAKSKQPFIVTHRKELLAAIDVELAKAPPAKSSGPRTPADRQAAAWKAHRTMLLAELPTVRGKDRAEVLARIAHYDEKIGDKTPIAKPRAPRATRKVAPPVSEALVEQTA